MTVKSRLNERIPPQLYQGLRYLHQRAVRSKLYGRVFRETAQFLETSQWWSKGQLEEYQMLQLRSLLKHAYDNVPYYRKAFDEHGIRPNALQDFDDIRKFPYLTKEIIQGNLSDLLAKNYRSGSLEYITTGGSTGIPMGLYIDNPVAYAKERAFVSALWGRVGYRVGDKSAVLRGNVVRRITARRYWEYDFLERSLIFSSYHMTDETLDMYVRKIRDFAPAFIQAYPSAATILADFMTRKRLRPFESVRAVLCGSENLYAWQRKLMEEAFRCRIYSFYGHAEKAALAGECEDSQFYHISPEYGYVELVGEEDRPVVGEGQVGEIVATSFINFAMPLIRYRTMDLGVRSNQECTCGRNYPLLRNVEGRLQELIVTGTGRRISMTAINMHSDVFDNVRQFQFYQEEKGKLILNIVRRPGYAQRDTNSIRQQLQNKLGEDVELHIQFMDDIPRTSSGKFRFLIQKIPIEFGD